MKYLVFYEMAADGFAKAPANLPAHQARLKEFHQRGTLLMVGPYGTPPLGALGIFTTRAAAEEFVAGDPYVIGSRGQTQHPRVAGGTGTVGRR